MEKKWFVLYEGQVQGPFLSTELEQSSMAHEGLIWGRGLSGWLNFSKWKQWSDKEAASLETQKVKMARPWHVRIIDKEFGPFLYSDMVELLNGQNSYENIWIWTEGYKEWQSLFGFHKLMDDLGIGRRAHPRVPLSGQAEIKTIKGHFNARLISISEGGAGITDITQVSVGETLHIQINSKSIPQTINAQAEVVYIDSQSSVGLKFSQISNESKSMIIDYIRKYLNESTYPNL